MDGETIDRHPGERARPGSPPGWYADPIRESSLRRWNGEHWTADVDPPAAVAEAQPSAQRHPFNWPVFAGYVAPLTFILVFLVIQAEWFGGDALLDDLWGPYSFYFFVFFPVVPLLLGLVGAAGWMYTAASRAIGVVLFVLGGLWLWSNVAVFIWWQPGS